MTMLLIMEALEEGTITKETMVPVSATAAGMGGSQVYMKEGESFSVHDMLKACLLYTSISWAMESPRPVPPDSRERALSTR